MDQQDSEVWRVIRLAAVVALGVIVAFPAGASAGQLAESARAVPVVFEGEPIDLSADWGDAEACLVWRDVGVAECFRNEAEMDAKIAELEKQLELQGAGAARTSQCSGYLRLYDGSYHTGQVLYMRDRLQWINLSGFGFSNRASSFKIGPCSSYLADYNWGGGSWYSTKATQAWDVVSVMASGWNNRVSSVYIR
ncbi:MAG: hypothetical protein WBN71_11870 [Acidimicrobiia bacterium]